MGWATWAAIYFTVWWTVLFMVLPFGVKRDMAPEVGHEVGAPAQPMIIKKFLWTTVISAALVLLALVAVKTGVLDWRALMRE